MMKNDITYEYRVFTNRRIDIESMEVGICTSKVIKELKPKDKVDGRFFHTSDSDEWYFCWNGGLQKLNLKGDADVNAALDEVKKLIGEADAAVDAATKIASEAKDAADKAQNAAADASAAVESIENKADKSYVEDVENAVKLKADKSVVDELLSKAAMKSDIPTNVSEFINDAGYLTEHQDISGKQDIILDIDDIRTNAAKGATALQEIPSEYITESELGGKGYATESYVEDNYAKKTELPTVPTNVSEFENDANYLTVDVANSLYAPIGSAGDGSGNSYATTGYVDNAIAGKQDVISDLDDIRANASKGATALQEIPSEYVTEDELAGMGFATTTQVDAKQDVISDLDVIRANAALGATALQSVPDGYLTEDSLAGYATEGFVKDEIAKIGSVTVPTKVSELENDANYITDAALSNYFTKDEITDMIGAAIEKTNEILG